MVSRCDISAIGPLSKSSADPHSRITTSAKRTTLTVRIALLCVLSSVFTLVSGREENIVSFRDWTVAMADGIYSPKMGQMLITKIFQDDGRVWKASIGRNSTRTSGRRDKYFLSRNFFGNEN